MDSDHSLVIANIKIKLKRNTRPPVRKQRDVAKLAEPEIGKAYREILEDKIRNASWNLTDEQDIDKRVEGIVTVIQRLLRRLFL